MRRRPGTAATPGAERSRSSPTERTWCMSENTLQRAYDRLREQLAEDPPVMVKLLDGDIVLGVLVGVESREDAKGNEFEVAILGEVDVTGVSDLDEGFDEEQLVS